MHGTHCVDRMIGVDPMIGVGNPLVVQTMVWNPWCGSSHHFHTSPLQAGTDPPPEPVRLYRDPLATGGNDGDAPTEGPRLVPPVGFTLVFRDSAHPPVTIWRPMAPRGYAEVRESVQC